MWVRLGDGPLLLIQTVPEYRRGDADMSSGDIRADLALGRVEVLGVSARHPRPFQPEPLLLGTRGRAELQLPLPEIHRVEIRVLHYVLLTLALNEIWLSQLSAHIG